VRKIHIVAGKILIFIYLESELAAEDGGSTGTGSCFRIRAGLVEMRLRPETSMLTNSVSHGVSGVDGSIWAEERWRRTTMVILRGQ
jgi:hypothetical protein